MDIGALTDVKELQLKKTMQHYRVSSGRKKRFGSGLMESRSRAVVVAGDIDGWE